MTSITETVRDKYGAVARSGLSNDSAAVQSVATTFGYSAEPSSCCDPSVSVATATEQDVSVHDGLTKVAAVAPLAVAEEETARIISRKPLTGC